jgi:hypothetical protein
VTWPEPRPGLVIRYSYLWHREAAEGQEEGRKDRPCAVILALQDLDEGTRVFVLPITHTPPAGQQVAVELPAMVKARLGLDTERSWIVLDEFNEFIWPGPDLRFLPGKGPESSAYGFLPPRLLQVVRDRFLTAIRTKRSARIVRTD